MTAAERIIGPDDRDADWIGNNAAFTCPACGKVFLVSGHMHRLKAGASRDCPSCAGSTGVVIGGRETGGRVFIRTR